MECTAPIDLIVCPVKSSTIEFDSVPSENLGVAHCTFAGLVQCMWLHRCFTAGPVCHVVLQGCG